MAGFFHKSNEAVAKSFVGKFFKLDERKTTFWTELRAGLTTFVTMSYIIAVNAAIVSDTGGPCECPADLFPCFPGKDVAYDQCVFELRKSLITATTAGSLIGCFLMGAFANLPIALAPGMGLNAYFAYTVVGFRGTGSVPFEVALAAVFIEGVIFAILSILGLRQALARFLPQTLKLAMGVGIGFFLAHIGGQTSEGIGLITYNQATLVTLGGCPLDDRNERNECLANVMRGPTTWVGIMGFFLIAILMLYRVRGGIFMIVLFVSIISWPRGTLITYFPYTPLGDAKFDYFKQVVAVPNASMTAGKLNFDLSGGAVWLALITFLYVDIFDATGTLYSMANFGGFTDKYGDFPGAEFAFLADAVAISIGAVLGTSPVTAFIESAAGIAEGGRTGLTAITVSFFFFIALFFAPIFASIPPWATGPALIVVGCLMAQGVSKINWRYYGDAIPAFATIALMPLTYSIGYGIIGGIFVYLVLNGGVWLLAKVSGGKIVPPDHDKREKYNAYNELPILPKWIRSLYSKATKKPMWEDTPKGQEVLARYDAIPRSVLEAEIEEAKHF
ncbi:permease family-domain-containing protein [Hyaloraphidium curvatum]|nr:permease family-domain-containing protein [Hyaloraphidium curvatum]